MTVADAAQIDRLENHLHLGSGNPLTDTTRIGRTRLRIIAAGRNSHPASAIHLALVAPLYFIRQTERIRLFISFGKIIGKKRGHGRRSRHERHGRLRRKKSQIGLLRIKQGLAVINSSHRLQIRQQGGIGNGKSVFLLVCL